jgi:hypothetical protein
MLLKLKQISEVEFLVEDVAGDFVSEVIKNEVASFRAIVLEFCKRNDLDFYNNQTPMVFHKIEEEFYVMLDGRVIATDARP